MLLPRAMKARWAGVSTEFILALEDAIKPLEKPRVGTDGFRDPFLDLGALELENDRLSRELVGGVADCRD